MERIVYLLGAGFSAPLGLPVMSNFYFKSQNMYFEDPAKYAYFASIFDTIRKISVGKNYFETNVSNIEDVLSILEMGDYLNGNEIQQQFKDYIIDVIERYTPPIKDHFKTQRVDWDVQLVGNERLWVPYVMFSCALLGVRFYPINNPQIHSASDAGLSLDAHPDVEYSVITLNYDRVLELVPERINRLFARPFKISYALPDKETAVNIANTNHRLTPLAKLHGSTDTREIVPPTWSKGVVKTVASAWKMAHRVLSEATQIRIVGYSLPTADAYVKYLLKSAVIESDNRLQKIDVVCRDGDGSVRKRYDEFVKFDYYNFISGDVTDYLRMLMSVSQPKDYQLRMAAMKEGWKFDRLEDAHAKFMAGEKADI
jgi:hypothetical protein